MNTKIVSLVFSLGIALAGTSFAESNVIAEDDASESAYSGQEITWEAAMNSQRDYTPKEFTLGDCPFPEVPMPRNYRFY